MSRRTLLAALLVCGCSSKKSADRDCEAYANKVADLSDPAPGKRDESVRFSRGVCERGRIADRELACVMSASTRAQLIECTTGKPAVTSTDTPPATPDAVTAAKGTNAVTLVAAQNGEGFKPLDLALHEDQRQWFEGLKKDVAACATDEVYEPRQHVVVVTFGPGTPAIMLGGLPAPLSYCVKEVLSRKQPSSVGNGPAELFIDVGK